VHPALQLVNTPLAVVHPGQHYVIFLKKVTVDIP